MHVSWLVVAGVVLIALFLTLRPVVKKYRAVGKTIRMVDDALDVHEPYCAQEEQEFSDMIDGVVAELAMAKNGMQRWRFRIDKQLEEAQQHADAALEKMRNCIAWLDHCGRTARARMERIAQQQDGRGADHDHD
jgi:hypothetical protein